MNRTKYIKQVIEKTGLKVSYIGEIRDDILITVEGIPEMITFNNVTLREIEYFFNGFNYVKNLEKKLINPLIYI